jgi:tetratricopeptide (TPR) repeat protein
MGILVEMMRIRRVKFIWICVVAIILAGMSSGCLYYNTFFNARQAFNEAEKTRKSSGTGTQSGYQKAVDKSLKIIENHPNSKYYDDALFVIGVSYFYLKQYQKSERRLNELVTNYPNSGDIKEATMYLARAKLQLNDTKEALNLFNEIYNGKYDREYRAEVALELGKYNTTEKNYKDAEQYLRSVRDSLGNDKQKIQALRQLINVNIESFSFSEALRNCKNILSMKPEKNDKYFALSRAAQSSYRLQRIKDGLAYLDELIKDPLYFDSLEVLKLMVGQGYEYAGDLVLAEETYQDVAITGRKGNVVGKAYYSLGLIYQFDYDNLVKAKEFYDKASESDRVSDVGKEALQRSSDIAKAQTLAKTANEELSAAIKQKEAAANDSGKVAVDTVAKINDSLQKKPENDTSVKIDDKKAEEIRYLAKQEKFKIDNTAATLLQLSELYWFQLNKQDSAINELKFLLEHFPSASKAPTALLSLSQMYRDYIQDTVGADSILRILLVNYPHSDDVPEALKVLNLTNTPADTGYAAIYFNKGEDFLIDSLNIDSALYYFQYVVDHFPESKYYQQAWFNEIWTTENFRSPGDSSLVVAYKKFADAFPLSTLAKEATKKITYHPDDKKIKRDEEKPKIDSTKLVTALNNQNRLNPDSLGSDNQDSARTYIDPLQAVYVGPKGEPLILLDLKPQKQEVDFEYPSEALSIDANEFLMYFQILLDFSGRVVDYSLKIPSEVEELNRRVKDAVESMTFDPLEVSKRLMQKAETMNLPEDQVDPRGRWYVYKYIVQKPSTSR